MVKVAIAGATGYTGSELLRILYNHPETEIIRVTSEQSAGLPLTSLFPQFRDLTDLTLEPLQTDTLVEDVDIVFMALPHTQSMKFVPSILRQEIRVIDLSADFRLHDPSRYQTWYRVEHSAPELMRQGVYGLPEFNRKAIAKARLVANPGCYPTCALLGLAPLLSHRVIDLRGIIIDAKSGITGAGKSPKPHLHFPEANEALMAYRVGEHQHTPEIEQEMARIAGEEITVQFTPHLIPMNRGVLTTSYATLRKNISTAELISLYRKFYQKETFVRVLPAGHYPNTRHVRGTNLCDIGLKVDERTGRVIIVSAIDNLVKGASGQAVQNMNIMTGIDEATGLNLHALTP